MGFLDLFKPRALPPPKIEDIFKLTPVSVTMEQLGVMPTGISGVCFRSIGTENFEHIKNNIVNILTNNSFLARYEVYRDDYGFTWVVIDSDSLGDSVANVYLASQLMIDGSYGDHILIAIFRFEKDEKPVYWIYNYRRASFYPFAPRGKERDVEIEYRLRMLVMDELPVDSLDYWFPVWGIPF